MVQRIQLPDNSVAEFPDGMPTAAIEAVLQKQFASNESAAETARLARQNPVLAPDMQAYRASQVNARKLVDKPPGYVEQFAGGAKHAWDRAAMGLKGLVTDLSDEDKTLLRQGRAFVENTGPTSTVGQITADVAMAAPLGGVLQAARHVPTASRAVATLQASPLAGALAAAGVNAGYAAATAPENREQAAAFGALGSLGGSVLNRALATPVRVKEAAKQYLDAGVPLTPGQAGAGVVGKAADAFEQGLAHVPILRRALGGKIAQQRELASDLAQRQFMGELGDAARLVPGPSVTRVASRASDPAIAPMTNELTARQVLSLLPVVPTAFAGLGPTTALALTTLLGSTAAGQRYLLGQTSWQRLLAENPQLMQQIGRIFADRLVATEGTR
jgi:hypothetical protein